MSGAILSLPQHAFIAWCLVRKHMGNFTFYLFNLNISPLSHSCWMQISFQLTIRRIQSFSKIGNGAKLHKSWLAGSILIPLL
jgi:hypothetical protein